jgi:hypothetical protein
VRQRRQSWSRVKKKGQGPGFWEGAVAQRLSPEDVFTCDQVHLGMVCAGSGDGELSIVSRKCVEVCGLDSLHLS